MLAIMTRMVARDSTNPSHRGKTNGNYCQMLELKSYENAGTITTVEKDNLVLELDSDSEFVLVRANTKKGFVRLRIGGAFNVNFENSKHRRGRVMEEGNLVSSICCQNNNSVVTKKWTWKIGDDTYRIKLRKLTPLECWRLMGFSDSDFRLAEKVCSNTQLYKQAGNSIVVNVLEALFSKILESVDVIKDKSEGIAPNPHQGFLFEELIQKPEPEVKEHWEEIAVDSKGYFHIKNRKFHWSDWNRPLVLGLKINFGGWRYTEDDTMWFTSPQIFNEDSPSVPVAVRFFGK